MKSCSTNSNPRLWTLTPVGVVLPLFPSPHRQIEPIEGEIDAKAFAWDKELCFRCSGGRAVTLSPNSSLFDIPET